MHRSHNFNFVQHPDGYHVYQWLVVTDQGRMRRKQVTSWWLNGTEPAETPPVLLRRLADQMERVQRYPDAHR